MFWCHDGEIGSGNSVNVSRSVWTPTHCKLPFGELVPRSPQLPCSASLVGIRLSIHSLSLVIAGIVQSKQHSILKPDKLAS